MGERLANEPLSPCLVANLGSTPIESVYGHHSITYSVDQVALLGGLRKDGSPISLETVHSFDLKTNHVSPLPNSADSFYPESVFGFSSCLAHGVDSGSSGVRDIDATSIPLIAVFGGESASSIPSGDVNEGSLPSLVSHSRTRSLNNTLSVYVPLDNVWIPVKPSTAVAPCPRVGATLAAFPPSSGSVGAQQETQGFIVIGGMDAGGASLADIWLFDLATARWVELPTLARDSGGFYTTVSKTAALPAARQAAGACWVGCAKDGVWHLAVTGGANQSQLLQDAVLLTFVEGFSDRLLAKSEFSLGGVMVDAHHVSGLTPRAGHSLVPVPTRVQDQTDICVFVMGGFSSLSPLTPAPAGSLFASKFISGEDLAVLPVPTSGDASRLSVTGSSFAAVTVASSNQDAILRWPAPVEQLSSVATVGIVSLGGLSSPDAAVMVPGVSSLDGDTVQVLDSCVKHLPTHLLQDATFMEATKKRIVAAYDAKFQRAKQGAIAAQQMFRRMKVFPALDMIPTSEQEAEALAAGKSIWRRFVTAKFSPDHAAELIDFVLDPQTASAAIPPKDLAIDSVAHLGKAASSLCDEEDDAKSEGEEPVKKEDELTAEEWPSEALMVRRVTFPKHYEDISDAASISAATVFGLPRLLQFRRALVEELANTLPDDVELFGAAPTAYVRPEEIINMTLARASANATKGLDMQVLSKRMKSSMKRDRGSSSTSQVHPAYIREGLSEALFLSSITKESIPHAVSKHVADLTDGWTLGAVQTLVTMPFMSPVDDHSPFSQRVSVKTLRSLKGKHVLALDSVSRGMSPLQLTGLLREIGGESGVPNHHLEDKNIHLPWPSLSASNQTDTRLGARFQAAVLALGQGALVITKTVDAISIGLLSSELLETNATGVGLIPGEVSHNAAAYRNPICIPVASMPLAGLAAGGGIPLSAPAESNTPDQTGERLLSIIQGFFATNTQSVAPATVGSVNTPHFVSGRQITAGGALMPNKDIVELNEGIRNQTAPTAVGESVGLIKEEVPWDPSKPWVPKVIVGPVLGQPDLPAQALIQQYCPLTQEELCAEVLRVYRATASEATRVIVYDLNFDNYVLAGTDFDIFAAPVSEELISDFAMNSEDPETDFQAGPRQATPSIKRVPFPCTSEYPRLIPAEGPTGPSSPTHKTRVAAAAAIVAAASNGNGNDAKTSPQPSPVLKPDTPGGLNDTQHGFKNIVASDTQAPHSASSSSSKSIDAPPPRVTQTCGPFDDHTEVVRVSEVTSVGIVDRPVSAGTLSFWTEVALKIASLQPSIDPLQGGLNRQDIYINSRLGAKALAPPFECLLDQARLSVDARISQGGALRDSSPQLNQRFPFWTSLAYSPDHSLSTLIFWGNLFARGAAVQVQSRLVLPTPPLAALNDLSCPSLPSTASALDLSCDSSLVDVGKQLFSPMVGAGCPAHPTAIPKVLDLNLALEQHSAYEQGCICASQNPACAWVRPYDFLKSTLKDVVELPFFATAPDFRRQGWVLLGHVNDLHDSSPALCESGVLLYSKGKLVSRMDIPFPCAPKHGSSLFKHDGSGVEGLMKDPMAHNKLCVLVGVPNEWEVDYSGRRFVAEGSLAFAKQVRGTVIKIVSTYLAALQADNLTAMTSKYRSMLKAWLVKTTKQERARLLLYHCSRRRRTATDTESDPNPLLIATRRAGTGHHNVHVGHFAIMDNDKQGKKEEDELDEPKDEDDLLVKDEDIKLGSGAEDEDMLAEEDEFGLEDGPEDIPEIPQISEIPAVLPAVSKRTSAATMLEESPAPKRHKR